MEIYVYGTGCGAGDLIDRALPAGKVTAFVDRRGGADRFLGRPVISLEDLVGRDFDLLIVASREAETIGEECRRLGLDTGKLLFLKNHLELRDRNSCYEMARTVLGEAFTERLICSERLIRVPLWTETERITGPDSDNDYVRLKTLEALCGRLEPVPGAAAELGVYRGGFARWINELMPGRKLYLFDTFEGFDPAESAGLGAGCLDAHRNTGPGTVMEKMPHPEQVLIRRGLFPRTGEGLEAERFALVSLDVDLEESSLAGLEWFLPRMSRGGCLLLHDYNNPRLPGVRRALERYEAEHGRLSALPLCDVNGTLAIMV